MPEGPPPKKEKEELTCPAWMMTMGDAMSLLLTFFVLLMTFSTPDESKLMDVLGGIQGALSIIRPDSKDLAIYKYRNAHTTRGKLTGGTTKKVKIKKENIAPVDLRSLEVINQYNQFQERILSLGFKNFISVKQLDEGIAVFMETKKLFPNGSLKINPELYQALESFANLVKTASGNEVRITACFKPPSIFSSSYLTEWNRQFKYTTVLGDYLMKRYKIPSFRFSYGEKNIIGDKPDYIEFLIVEKLGTSEMTIADFIKMK